MAMGEALKRRKTGKYGFVPSKGMKRNGRVGSMSTRRIV
ncbi:hypothetical protein B4113_2013 [Geobacillus sp. B4113_201601]|nr:hypothetical protein B4113_2013 [Geobacillus sp. B4113_201601]